MIYPIIQREKKINFYKFIFKKSKRQLNYNLKSESNFHKRQ